VSLSKTGSGANGVENAAAESSEKKERKLPALVPTLLRGNARLDALRLVLLPRSGRWLAATRSIATWRSHAERGCEGISIRSQGPILSRKMPMMSDKSIRDATSPCKLSPGWGRYSRTDFASAMPAARRAGSLTCLGAGKPAPSSSPSAVGRLPNRTGRGVKRTGHPSIGDWCRTRIRSPRIRFSAAAGALLTGLALAALAGAELAGLGVGSEVETYSAYHFDYHSCPFVKC
jgi:hypothetical protein